MMASHRSTEPLPLEKPLPHESTAPAPTALETLPPSGLVVGIDWFLGLAILALAFLLASFSVRNSDFFMHLAAGRLLSEGGYTLGKDPFSFVGGDRTWVNHAWLFDWVLFRLFSAAGGPGVVIAKAVVVALAAGTLLLARRPGQSVFPGVICVGLALIAMAPRLLLQPGIASILCLSILMGLLIRGAKLAGSWRFPICIAVLFAFWSNMDQWFVLGPIFLLLYIVGHIIRPDSGENAGTLWKALLLGILACMVNPHHFRVWMLPPELADASLAKVLGDDIEMGGIFRGALTKGSLDFAGERDNPATLYCLLGLLALGLVGFISNYKRLSIGLALVWAGGVTLAILHLRAIPYLACVAAPIAALNLAEAMKRLTDVPRSERSVRAFLAVRSVSRGLAVFAALLLIALSYPGWLNINIHPPRRWAWDVEPNPSMQRTAEQLKEWKDAGLLPAEARLLNLQPDFAHYVAWYAPEIKSFFDYRLRFHRDEAPNYAALRKHLAPRGPRDSRADSFDMSGFLRNNGITYAVTSHPSRRWNEAVLGKLVSEVPDPTRGPEWALWHIEGRAVVLGWTRQGTIPRSTFDRLRFEPLRSAYVYAKPLKESTVEIPLPPQSVWERYIMAPPVSPPEGEEAILLLRYREALREKAAMQQRSHWVAMHLFAQRFSTPVLNLWTLLPFQQDSPIPTINPPDVDAAALLAVRAARRAIISSPDHPDGYFYLALAYPAFARHEFSQDIRHMVSTASLTRCRARISEDPTQKRSITYVQELLDSLRDSHLQASPPRLDLRLEATISSSKFLRANTEELEIELGRYEGEERKQKQEVVDFFNRRLKEMDREIESLSTTLQKSKDQYVNVVASLSSPLDRASVARRYGLVREAIKELFNSHESLQKQLGADGDGKKLPVSDLPLHLAVHAELVELMIYDGRVEEAAKILGTMDDPDSMRAMEDDKLRQAYFTLRRKALSWLNPKAPNPSPFDENPALRYRSLRQAISLILGDFTRAAEIQANQLQATRKELEEKRATDFPKGTPDTTNIPSERELIWAPYHQPTLAALHYARHMYYRKIEDLVSLAQAFAVLQVRVGMTYLEQGNVPLAAHHFRQSLETPEIKTPLQVQRVASEYLEAFKRAGLPQGGTP